MLHLAQVQQTSKTEGITLQLLAQQDPEKHWLLSVTEFVTIPPQDLKDTNPLLTNVGVLVLVELDESQNLKSLEAATQWILDLIQRLSTSPENIDHFLSAESQKIEKWRQELTLKSQELSMKNIELETRREQLEKTIEEEKAELERRKEELNG